MYDATLAETVTIAGHGGDEIEAYLAQPVGRGPLGGVVVIHHMPGYDRRQRRSRRRFAADGYIAVMPNLYSRERPGASPDDAAAAARAAGGVPDDAPGRRRRPAPRSTCVAARVQRQGRRHRLLLGRAPVVPGRLQLKLDAAVDCYGLSSSARRPRACRCKAAPSVTWPRTCPARCSACSAPTTSTRRPSRWPSSKRSWRSTAKPTSSTPMRAPGTLSSPWTAPPTAPRPPSTAGQDPRFGRYLAS